MKRNTLIIVAFMMLVLVVFQYSSHSRIVYGQSSDPSAKAPLYRMHDDNTDQYLLTTSADELNSFISQGWTYEKIIGYVYTSNNATPPNGAGTPSETPLYRLHNSQTGEYIEDTDTSLTQQPATAWTIDTTLGFVSLSNSPGVNAVTVPVYKVINPVENSEFLTANTNELSKLAGGGWPTPPDVTLAFRAIAGPPMVSTVNTPGWPKQLGTPQDEGVERILIDHSGAIYIVGSSDGMLFRSNTGGDDCIVIKYDANGNRLWGKQFGTSAADLAMSACIDSSNNLYVVGITDGNLFGTSAGSTDAFVTKFSPDGTTLWSKQIGTPSTDFASDVAVDAQNNVYVVGETGGSLFGQNSGTNGEDPIFPGDGKGKTLEKSGTDSDLRAATDAYIVEYDAGGNQLWSKQFGDGGISSASRIRLDNAGDIYVAGGTGSLFGQEVTGYDAYVAKFAPDKTLVWGQQFGSVNLGDRTDADGLCLDAGGNVYVGGITNMHDNIDGNPDTEDGYVTKFDTNGNILWSQPWSTAAADDVLDLALDSQGNIYAVGQTEGSLFGPFAGGDYNGAMAKYDTNGNLIASVQYGGYTGLASIAVDAQDRLYLAGGTNVSLFGLCAGGDDIFIQRLDANGQVAKLAPPSLPQSKLFIDALGVRSPQTKQPSQKTAQCAWAGEVIKLNYPPVLVGSRPYMYVGYTGVATRQSRVMVSKGNGKQVTVVSRERQVCVHYGSSDFSLNGKMHRMSGKPMLIGHACYVPLEVVQASVPIPVHYDAKSKRVNFDPPRLVMRGRIPRKLAAVPKRLVKS